MMLGPFARIAARLANIAHQSWIVVIQLDERFGQIEVQRSALETFLPQLPRQRVHLAQRG
jgi:hypothetical protein